MKKISLIIPAFSDSFYVEDILVNILLWSIKPSEIIIVNTSKKKILISRYIKQKIKQNRIHIKIINKKNSFPGAARNIGISKSRYNYIVFLDMNTLPYNINWLEKNFNYLIKNNLDGVYGKTYYLTNNFKEKIIRASTYGKAYLRTIPGSIFKKKTIKKVGSFDSKTRAGEDTDWLKRLDKCRLRIKDSLEPIYYKGLYNISFKKIIKKWFRNYLYSSNLTHLSTQKTFYMFGFFLTLFIIVFNWNHSSFNWPDGLGIYIPHITKGYLLICSLSYIFLRGIYIPMKKKIKKKFLLPFNFLLISFVSFILDSVKLLSFLVWVFSRLTGINRYNLN